MPLLSPTVTFSIEGASPEDIVTQAFAAYMGNDEHTLLRLYTKEAANICILGFGSITTCIGIAYDIRGLEKLEEWYLLADEDPVDDTLLVVETVITRWAGDDNLWRHDFILEKVNGNWLISQPLTKIDVYNG